MDQKHGWEREGYTISTDKSLLDIDRIYHYLSTESYWAKGIHKEVLERAITHTALCFGLYTTGQEQIGFARVITDFATFAYLADVFIIEDYRGQGLSKWLIDVIIHYPDLQNLRRFMLATKDAHSLYAQFGFTPIASPEFFMEIAPGRKGL